MICDTNIIIGYLHGDQKIIEVLSDWKMEERALFISSLTLVEVLAYPRITTQQITDAKSFLRNFILLSVDAEIAEAAAEVRRKTSLRIPDAVIAATALVQRQPLVTRDKDFHALKDLTIIEV